jgi:hypothetical protein
MVDLIMPECSRAPTNRPALSVERDLSGVGWIVIARNLRPDLVATGRAVLDSLIRVAVADRGAADGDELPDVSGEREVAGGEVRFRPHFPFEPGVRFRAILDLGAIGQAGSGQVLTHEFSFPAEAPEAEAEVSRVFPSADVLPENLLRFHVRFSRPMRRGRAAASIEILGPDGAQAPDVLYRAPVELWDRSMTCLTVLLDPGRLKRGVGPNRLLGPPLKVGGRYKLSIGQGMIDTHGRPLLRRFVKAFIVCKAARAPVAIENWTITPPAPGGHERLAVTFPTPLDWTGLWRGVTVASAGGEQLCGRIDVDQGETRWRFTPDAAWRAGAHSVRISPGLEDACGNTPYGAFDGPLRSADQIDLESAVRSIPFEVKAA